MFIEICGDLINPAYVRKFEKAYTGSDVLAIIYSDGSVQNYRMRPEEIDSWLLRLKRLLVKPASPEPDENPDTSQPAKPYQFPE